MPTASTMKFERFDDRFDFFTKFGRLLVVSAFAVPGEVQTKAFIFNVHPQAGEGINRLGVC